MTMIDDVSIPTQSTTASRPSLRRIAGTLLWALIGAYGLSVTGFLGLRLLVGERLIAVGLFENFMLPLVLPSMVLLPASLLSRRWRYALFLLAPAAQFIGWYGPFFVPRAHAAPEGAPQFSLLTYNIHAEAIALDPMIAVIRASGADVVTLQELSFSAADRFSSALADEYPYQVLHPNTDAHAGQGILSRFPVAEDTYWQNDAFGPGDVGLGHQRAVIDVEGTRVVLYNTHPVHPGMGGHFFEPGPRGREIDDLLLRALGEQDPVILAGDFNMTDQTEDYAQITADYADSFREVGFGLGVTFPDLSASSASAGDSDSLLAVKSLLRFPILRLDFVFHCARLAAVEARVGESAGGSDHRPLFVRLAVINADTPS